MPTITEQWFSRSNAHRRVIDLANDSPSAPLNARHRPAGGRAGTGCQSRARDGRRSLALA
jgi:hypothetical protein